MAVYYPELESPVEKLVSYLQGQGHSKSLCNQNMTVSVISFKLYPFATRFALMVHHRHKPECSMEQLDCCVQGRGHSEGSKCL